MASNSSDGAKIIFNKQSLISYSITAIVSLVLAIGFYFDGRKASVVNLSSDQWNILPVCMKLDHSGLFEGDMVADNVRDVKYYTPLFVNSLRFFAGVSHDNYIEGLNKANLLINFSFTFFWTILFWLIGRNLPIALLMSTLVRGILWLPGNELWGAGALWTALPRTVFLALIPIVLILFLPSIKNKKAQYLGGLVGGIISNFHPISGVSVCTVLIVAHLIFYLKKDSWKSILLDSFIILLLFTLGISPYLFTYFVEVLAKRDYDYLLFNQMMQLRIGDQFREPMHSLANFLQVKWLVLIFAPIVFVLVFYKRFNESQKQLVVFYSIFLGLVISTSLLSVPFEKFLNTLGLKINMSFQIIRNIKYILIPIFIFIFVLLVQIITTLSKINGTKISIFLLILFICISLVSRIDPVKRLPIIGDDFIRATLPNTLSIKPEIYSINPELEAVFRWINTNTEPNSKFIGPTQIRSACKRSVVYDYKGASMLIEGNPTKFILWGIRHLELKRCITVDCLINLYQNWGADYLVTDKISSFNSLYPIQTLGNWAVFKLK